ncbi:S-layer homology domain-containing protein [Candidatus Saganbacteria bacterium]|nr:S-layer homology domain-containing protein [Candidatus Saganbacteria bacterium]
MKKIGVLILLIGLCLAAATAADVKFSSDVTRLAVGARPLGMGRMFTGLSDDLSAMYLNPAGLTQLNTSQWLTMSGKFINQVNYLALAAALPTKSGALGIGYSGAGLGFTVPVLNLVEIATGEYRVIPSTTESVSYDYNNSALAFSYAANFLLPRLSVGATLKLFSETFGGAAAVSGQGTDLDLGLLFKPNNYLSLGVTGKNILPANLGGKMTWSTKLVEAIPATLISGANLQFASARLGRVNMGADYELQPSQPSIPGFWHIGLEWWPLKNFALRGGLDQDVIGSGSGTGLTVSNNPTAGVSLYFSDFRFDYAYHRYNDVANNDTQYFSLSHIQPETIPLQVFPGDPFITRESTVVVSGIVNDSNVKQITINGQPISFSQGKFSYETSLLLGKNTILVAGLNRQGKIIRKERLRVLRLIKFSDVTLDYWARNDIELLGTLNIMPGFIDGTFKPEKMVSRVDYLMNLLNIGKLPPSTILTPFPFRDVQTTEVIAPYVKSGHDHKLVKGYPDLTFRPWRLLNRVEGALMTVRFSQIKLSDVLERPYLDIAARHWAIKEITAAKEHSMLQFALEYLYPRKELPRSELAAMIAYVPLVRLQIEELLNFDVGY